MSSNRAACKTSDKRTGKRPRVIHFFSTGARSVFQMTKREASFEMCAKRMNYALDESALGVVCRWLADRYETNSNLVAICKGVSGMFNDLGEFLEKKPYRMITINQDISVESQSWFLELGACPFQLLERGLRKETFMPYYSYWKSRVPLLTHCTRMSMLSTMVRFQDTDGFMTVLDLEFPGARLLPTDPSLFCVSRHVEYAAHCGKTKMLDFFQLRFGITTYIIQKFREDTIHDEKTLGWILNNITYFNKNWEKEYLSHYSSELWMLKEIFRRSKQALPGRLSKLALSRNRIDILEWYVETGHKTHFTTDMISSKTSLEAVQFCYAHRNPEKTDFTSGARLATEKPEIWAWLIKRENIPIDANSLLSLSKDKNATIASATWFANANRHLLEPETNYLYMHNLSVETMAWLDELGYKFNSSLLARAYCNGRLDICRWLMAKGITSFSPNEFNVACDVTPELLDLLSEIFPDPEDIRNLYSKLSADAFFFHGAKRKCRLLLERKIIDPAVVAPIAFACKEFGAFDLLTKDMAVKPRLPIPSFRYSYGKIAIKAIDWLTANDYKWTLEDAKYCFNNNIILHAVKVGFLEASDELLQLSLRLSPQQTHMRLACWVAGLRDDYTLDELIEHYVKLC